MGRETYKAVRLLSVFLLFLAACVKDKPANTIAPVADTSASVYVICEGSLGNGNASLALYNTNNGIHYDEVFLSANNRELGDVFQSMQRIGDRLFLCVNNSDKVVVINRSDRTLVGTIDIPKPRYILPVSESKAYVSALFSNKVYIIDPRSLQVTGSITMPYQNTEGMLLHSGSAYFCTWDTACNKIYEIDPVTDVIEQEITVAGYAAQEVLVDRFDMLWVLSGNVSKGRPAALTRIDPASGQVIASYKFPEKADPIRPVFNNVKDVLYFIEVNYNGGTDNNGIYKMSVRDAVLPQQPFIPAEKFQYFWALGIEPVTDRIFVGDPKGFIQKGSVSIYNAQGKRETTFTTGIGPGHFYFDN